MSDSIPRSMPVDLARELARQGDVRLAALMALATASDLRAITLCGIFGGGAVAITAAVLAVYVSEHPSTELILAGGVLALCLYIAAILAAKAGAPCDFYIGGGNPDDLRMWSWDRGQWRSEIELLEATAERYAQSIKKNREILEKNARQINLALVIGPVSLIPSVVTFFVARRLGF